MTWNILKEKTGGRHIEIEYRDLKRFDENAFKTELTNMPFDIVMATNDPSEALYLWYTFVNKVFDNHAKLKKKELNQDLNQIG